MNPKHWTTLALAVIMIVAMLTACSPTPAASGTPAASETPAVSEAPAETPGASTGITPSVVAPPLYPPQADIMTALALPFVPEGANVELSLFMPLSSVVDDYVNNTCTKQIEEQTGLKLSFVTSPAADAITKRNLLLSSGDYPDIICSPLSRNEMALYAEQGVFISLDQYLDTYAKNALKCFEEYPGSKLACTGLDGKIYGLPDVNDCYHCNHGNGRLWYYTPWLEKAGGKLPETTEELKTYLMAIKNNDPNGNGKADEIPLAFKSDEVLQAVRFFMNSFCVYPQDGYRLDDGKITAVFTTDAFKQGLAYMADLYKNGLILQEAFSISGEDLVKIGEDPSAPLLGSIIGWGPESGTKKAGDTKRWFQYFVMPPVAGPSGDRWNNNTGTYVGSSKWYVTDKCENIEAAVRLGDLMLTEYIATICYIGPEGKGWEYPKEGELSILGTQANRKEIVTYGAQDMNTSWDQNPPMFRSSNYRLGIMAEGADVIYKYLDGDLSLMEQASQFATYNEILKYYQSKKNLNPYQFDDKYNIPPLLYNATVGAEVADITAVITPYFTQKIADFVMGVEDVETGFPKFVSELESMGLKTLVADMQAAYDSIPK